MRRAVQDYRMIEDGDRIFVGLSGGKDSTLLLRALADYRRFSPQSYTLEAITVDMGLKETDKTELDALIKYCESLDVPHHLVKTDIAEIIFDIRKESNPCSLCAKMRRGALNNEINRLGGGKLALGHNADDVAETMLLSLLYEGRFSCFPPTAHMDKSGVSLIRPFIYLEEYDIKSAVKRQNLPIVNNPCPMNHESQREYMKSLIKTICKDIPLCKTAHFGCDIPPRKKQPLAKTRKLIENGTRKCRFFVDFHLFAK